jgi:hypothetical protein
LLRNLFAEQTQARIAEFLTAANDALSKDLHVRVKGMCRNALPRIPLLYGSAASNSPPAGHTGRRMVCSFDSSRPRSDHREDVT